MWPNGGKGGGGVTTTETMLTTHNEHGLPFGELSCGSALDLNFSAMTPSSDP